MMKCVQPSPNMQNTTKSCWTPWRKENYVGMETWQEPVTCRRPSSKVLLKAEEEGASREWKGWTTLLSGPGRALPRPKPLPMTVWGGDSRCSVQQCSVPTTPGRLMIVMVMHINSPVMRTHVKWLTPPTQKSLAQLGYITVRALESCLLFLYLFVFIFVVVGAFVCLLLFAYLFVVVSYFGFFSVVLLCLLWVGHLLVVADFCFFVVLLVG